MTLESASRSAFVMPSEFCSRIKLASKMLIRSFCNAAAEVFV